MSYIEVEETMIGLPEKQKLSPEERIAQLEKAIERLKLENQRLTVLSTKDHLTGLDNRQRFNEELPRTIASAFRDRKPLSLVTIDIDGFKPINDGFGHSSGDLALQHLASLLQRGVRLADIIFRFGGDEFAALLPATGKAEAAIVTTRLRQNIECSPVMLNGQTEKALTISLGIDSFDPNEPIYSNIRGRNIIHLIPKIITGLTESSDKALYAAKTRGGNKIGIMLDNDAQKFAIGEALDPEQRRYITFCYRSKK